MAKWEHFSHVADVGIRGIGNSLEEAFEQGACAMTAVICELEKIRPEKRVKIESEDEDIEIMFVDWLNKIVFEMAVKDMLFSKFKVKIEGNKLSGEAWGERVDLKRHDSAVEVKAASYTELKVKKNDKGQWIAQCVVDV